MHNVFLLSFTSIDLQVLSLLQYDHAKVSFDAAVNFEGSIVALVGLGEDEAAVDINQALHFTFLVAKADISPPPFSTFQPLCLIVFPMLSNQARKQILENNSNVASYCFLLSEFKMKIVLSGSFLYI